MQELYNKNKILFSIGCIYLSEHLIGMVSFFVMKYLNFANGSAECAGKNHNEMPIIGNIMYMWAYVDLWSKSQM